MVHKTFLIQKHFDILKIDLESQLNKLQKHIETRFSDLKQDIQGILTFQYATQFDFFSAELDKQNITP